MPTSVGKLADGMLIARKGQTYPGLLSFGPYERLPRGEYRVTIELTVEAPADSAVGWWDIWADPGEKLKYRERIMGGEPRERVIERKFFSDTSLDLTQIRVGYDGGGDLSLSGIKIEMIEQAPLLESAEN